jgi:transcriptional regulator GlxA family with amidase domain
MLSSYFRYLAACLLPLSRVLAEYNTTYTGYPPSYCVGNNAITPSTSPPNKWAFVLFRAFEPLDIFGPYEALSTLAHNYHIDISWLAETLEPVSTSPQLASMNKFNSSAFISIPPTHTFATAPSDIEVLLIPGGAGARAPNLNATLEYIETAFPKLKYLITVCTGAMVVAKTGLLSGVRATTNKAAWNQVVATDPTAHWIPHARWAVDGKIWSSSGVSAGIDVTVAWIACHYGEEVAANVTK